METPPNYSQYSRPLPGGGFSSGGRGYRGPGIYFDYINDAWDMVKKNMAVYVVATLLVMIISQVVSMPFSFLNNFIIYGNFTGPKPGDLPQFTFSMFPKFMLVMLIPTAIGQVLYTGISLCALEEADTGTTSLNTLFSGFKAFFSVAATSILFFLAFYIGLCLCIVPGIFAAGVFAFAPIIAAKEGLGPIQSMQRSFEMLKPYAWANFGFLFVCSLVNFIGFFACCIGMLWTMPIMYIGMALHYREFRGPANQGFVAPMPTFTP